MIIYKVIFPNNKIYIGKTIYSLENRKSEHYTNSKLMNYSWSNCKFYRALRKYKTQEKWEILETCENEIFLNEREKFWINFYNSYKKGYNSTLGGDGGSGLKHTEEFKKNMSDRMRERIEKIGMFGKANPHYGHSHTEEWKQDCSRRMKENNPMKGKCGKLHHRFGTHPSKESIEQGAEKQRKLKKEDLDEILLLKQQGCTYQQIAIKFKVCRQTVEKFLKRKI